MRRLNQYFRKFEKGSRNGKSSSSIGGVNSRNYRIKENRINLIYRRDCVKWIELEKFLLGNN